MSARVCSHCGAENDETRVFCSNCGTRLVHAAAEPSVEATPAPEAPVHHHAPSAPVAPRVQRPAPGLSAPRLNPPAKGVRSPGSRNSSIRPLRQKSLLQAISGQVFITLLLAAVLAAMIQIARTPETVPAVQAPDDAAASQTMEQLRNGLAAEEPSSWVINDNAVNQFLATVVQAKETEAGPLTPVFVRTCAAIDRGSFDLIIEQSFLQRSLYYRLRGVLYRERNKLRVKWVGASAGRLPVHPSMIPYFRILFRQVFHALEPVAESLEMVKWIELAPGQATIEWVGGGANGAVRRPAPAPAVERQPVDAPRPAPVEVPQPTPAPSNPSEANPWG